VTTTKASAAITRRTPDGMPPNPPSYGLTCIF
jgi:hypothetical protein